MTNMLVSDDTTYLVSGMSYLSVFDTNSGSLIKLLKYVLLNDGTVYSAIPIMIDSSN